jgi:hypothetical protein
MAEAEDLSRTMGEAALPTWRKAYLANLIASGKRFAEAGNARGADYCFAKVRDALRDVPVAAPAEGPKGMAPAPAAERMRREWREARIEHAEKVLDSHGGRLSSLEKRAYRERLGKLREEAAQPSQAGKADTGILDLRRRLYQRVLKAQKVSLARKRAPASARPVPPARVSATPTAWQPVIGPYNDRSNIEELLGLIEAADPAWVEEFLELYGGLAALQGLVPSPAPGKK